MTLNDMVIAVERMRQEAWIAGHDPRRLTVRSIDFNSRVENHNISFDDEPSGRFGSRGPECEVSFTPYGGAR